MPQESKRQKQTAEIVKRHFSLMLQQEGPYIYGVETLVTVTSVKMSPDLNIAKIYVSVFNTEAKEEVIQLLEHSQFRLKQQFYQRLRKQVRRVPRLQFFLDDTLDEMYRLNNLFDEIGDYNKLGTKSSDEFKAEAEEE